MPNKLSVCASCLIFMLGVVGCSGARRDPCELLTADEVKSVDETVTYSLWAGRGGEKKDDEVCMFYTEDGEPRVMLFAWYDKDKDPQELTKKGARDSGAMVIDVPGVGTKAAALFADDELKLLAVKSSPGVVGLRVRMPVSKDSVEFDVIAQLAEKALSRNQ